MDINVIYAYNVGEMDEYPLQKCIDLLAFLNMSDVLFKKFSIN